MKRRIFSVVLAMCLCVSTVETTFGLEIHEETAVGLENNEDGNLVLREASSEDVPAAETVSGSGIGSDGNNNQQGTTGGDGSAQVTTDPTALTPSKVYSAMIALQSQDQYKEGTTWTNDTPHSGSGYQWHGGKLDGANISAVGCVAFAFILSDEAFGTLPARMYAKGGFQFEDIKVGDILRVNNDAHTVIVLEVSDAGVVVAEGNYSGKVHWGRAISKEAVMNDTSHYITRYPEGYVSPDDPEADKSIASGSTAGLAWNLTNAGTLTISGNGAMQDFVSVEDQPWHEHGGKIRKVVVGDGVTSIGSCAFWKCGVLSAEISSSVTTIGNSAFRGSSILSVAIPSSVKTIGDDVFSGCQNLDSVTISEGVETIGQRAFQSCGSLKSIVLPASVGEVGAAAFFQCQEMTGVKFAAGSKQVILGDNLFTQCYKLADVTLPQNVNYIGKEMFMNCMLLARVEIPKGAESIGERAFASCSSLKAVVVPDSVTTIGSAAFSACPLADLYFTGTETQWGSIRKMGDTASALSNVTIHYNYIPPVDSGSGTGGNTGSGGSNTGSSGSNSGGSTGSGGSSTGSSSNTGNSGNSSNTGSNGNNSGSGTGSNPENGDNAGGNSGSNAGDPSNSNTDGNTGGNSESGDPGNDDSSGSNEVPEPFEKGETFANNKGTYKVTKAGKEVQLVMPESTAKEVTINTITGADGVKYKVTSIGAKAMQNNKKLKSLTIGTNVKTIGAGAFSGCTKLKTVAFGKNVNTIGANAFQGCTSLKKTVTLPDSIKTVGAGAFSGCSQMKAVTIGKTSKSSLATIGKNEFNGCRQLNKITIRSTKLKSVGKGAFKGTKSGLEVKVPSKQWKKYEKLFQKAGLNAGQVTKYTP